MKKMLNNTLPGNAIVPVFFVLGFGGFVLIGTVLPWLRRTRRAAQVPGFWQEVTDVALPAVRPAWMFDRADATPECVICYTGWLGRDGDTLRAEDGTYLMPSGLPYICEEHAETPFARAVLERWTLMQEETTR